MQTSPWSLALTLSRKCRSVVVASAWDVIAATAHAASISTAAKAGDWTRMRLHCVRFMIMIDG